MARKVRGGGARIIVAIPSEERRHEDPARR
jgi:hypothetical protein